MLRNIFSLMNLKSHLGKMMTAVSVMIFAAIAVCIICNLAIDKTMTWLVYPVCSLIFGWGVLIPIIFKKSDGIIYSLIILTAMILPFLLILELWTDPNTWFIPLAFPISLIGIVCIWLLYFMWKKNVSFKAQLPIIIFGSGVVCMLIDIIISNYGVSAFPWGYLTFTITALVTAVILVMYYEVSKGKHDVLNTLSLVILIGGTCYLFADIFFKSIGIGIWYPIGWLIFGITTSLALLIFITKQFLKNKEDAEESDKKE